MAHQVVWFARCGIPTRPRVLPPGAEVFSPDQAPLTLKTVAGGAFHRDVVTVPA